MEMSRITLLIAMATFVCVLSQNHDEDCEKPNALGPYPGWLHDGSGRSWHGRQNDTGSLPEPRSVGCFNDDEEGMLRGLLVKDPNRMNRQLCYSNCERYNYRFAGLENGDECYCGNTFNRIRYRRRGMRECSTECVGAFLPGTGETCGGNNRLHLWRLP